MKIQVISSAEQLVVVYNLIKELRPHLSLNEFLSIEHDARIRDDYKIVGLFKANECIGLMGYRVLFDFVHQKHLYIDDLVITEQRRSEGFGKQLLKFAEAEAQRLNCKTLRLCTGVENKRGIRFYLQNGWEERAVVFKKKLK